MTLTIRIKENNFVLHPAGSVFWQERNTLLISDVHLGKVSHFRKHGMAVPGAAVSENFRQLDLALEFFNPAKIVFLGDLFHSSANKEWELFADWASRAPAQIILVEGNHDIIGKRFYTEIGIRVFPELVLEDFLLTHHPQEKEGLFNFCGHIHPGIKIYGSGRQSLKLPCFFHKENQLILPAFGQFTGNYFMVPGPNDIVYAVTKEEVILVAKN